MLRIFTAYAFSVLLLCGRDQKHVPQGLLSIVLRMERAAPGVGCTSFLFSILLQSPGAMLLFLNG